MQNDAFTLTMQSDVGLKGYV